VREHDPELAERVVARLALAIETRAQAYLSRYGDFQMRIGAALFDRQRHLRVVGPCGRALLAAFQRDLG
jgi:cobalt-precorrin-5B (C1)-methyltransferase